MCITAGIFNTGTESERETLQKGNDMQWHSLSHVNIQILQEFKNSKIQEEKNNGQNDA